MAECARAALLLCVLQVLALPATAADRTDAQGKSAGGEEALCGGLLLHVRGSAWKVPRVCGRLRGRGGN